MKCIKWFVLLLSSFLFLFCNPTEGDALSFSDAPTLSDYIESRGESKLVYVLSAVARLHFGATARDWDELEEQGTKMLQGLSAQSIAEFIFVNTYEYKLTMTFYQLLSESLHSEFAVQNKEYFDLSGSYIPLNAQNVLVRGGAFVDVANLFGASAILTTTRPLENGYEYSNNQLLINGIEMQLINSDLSLTQKILDFEVVSGENNSSGRYLPFVGSLQNAYNYQYTAAGMAQDYSFFRVDADVSGSLSELRLLTQMSMTITIGDMTRTVYGTGNIKSDLEIDKIVTVDPDEPLVTDGSGGNGGGSGEDDSGGGSWWDGVVGGVVGGLTDWLLEKLLAPLLAFFEWIKEFLNDFLLKPLLAFFDWIKDFFIPDFSGIADRFHEFVDLLTNKFSGVLEIMDLLSGFFVSEKSLHDLTVVWLDEKEYAIFPREYTEEFFVNLKRAVNVLIFMLTAIHIYKKITGEGDAIAT